MKGAEGKAMLESRFVVWDGNLNLDLGVEWGQKTQQAHGNRCSNLNLCVGEGYLNVECRAEGKAMLESGFVVWDGNLNLDLGVEWWQKNPAGAWKSPVKSKSRFRIFKSSYRWMGLKERRCSSLDLWCRRWQFESRSRCRMKTKKTQQAHRNRGFNLNIGLGNSNLAMLESKFVVWEMAIWV